MTRKTFRAIAVSLLPALAAAGCAGVEDGQPPEIEARSSALTASNGLSWNGLSWNGLSWNGLSWNGLSWNGLSWNGLAWNGLAWNGLAFNGLTFNGMTWNGLTWNGLTWNGLAFNGMTWNGITFNGFQDPFVHDFVTYMVQCALPPDDSVSYVVDGTEYTFEGEVGLAPEWKDQPCNETCQRWITACMLSRINRAGQHVMISMRGEHKGLKTEAHEVRDYGAREAAYYGNIFAGNDKIYMCNSPGNDLVERVCGDSMSGCPARVTGSCDRACRGEGRHKSFRDCRGDGKVYGEVITVFLRE